MDIRNILVRESGSPTTVYARCGGCGELVARYRLSEYYHHGKGLDSFIRSLGPMCTESGRDVLAQFNHVREEATDGYRAAMDILNEQGKAV